MGARCTWCDLQTWPAFAHVQAWPAFAYVTCKHASLFPIAFTKDTRLLTLRLDVEVDNKMDIGLALAMSIGPASGTGSASALHVAVAGKPPACCRVGFTHMPGNSPIVPAAAKKHPTYTSLEEQTKAIPGSTISC